MKRIVVILTALCLLPAAVPAADGLSMERTPEYDYDPPTPGTYTLPHVQEAGDGNVLTAEGKKAHLRDLVTGQVTILSFIYTRCADPRACPMATGALYDIHEASKDDADLSKGLRLVTFSFDPEHDTPSVMSQYGGFVRPGGKGSEWLFLTTKSKRELQPILTAYGQRVDRKKNPLDPLGPFYHMVRVYLIDAKGTVRNIYSYGMLDPRMVVADVRTLLMEQSVAGK